MADNIHKESDEWIEIDPSEYIADKSYKYVSNHPVAKEYKKLSPEELSFCKKSILDIA